MSEPATSSKIEDLVKLLAPFSTAEWSTCPSVLPSGADGYVYVFIVDSESYRFPLYVGQTGRLIGRFGDYAAAPFQAPTDFRVGEACRYFHQVDAKVHLLFRKSEARQKEERLLIRELILSGFPLLNSLSAFNYREANAEEERLVVHRFCKMALKHARTAVSLS